jgi:hypothetical protein
MRFLLFDDLMTSYTNARPGARPQDASRHGAEPVKAPAIGSSSFVRVADKPT